MLCGCRQAIGLKLYTEIVAASTASGSMIDGAYVLFGVMAMRTESKSSIIIKGGFLL